MNWAGSIMKTLIGTATVADVSKLHEIFEDLRHKNLELTQTLNQQITYIRELKGAEKVYLEGVTNIYAAVKEHMIQAHNEFQNFARDLMMFNISFQARSTFFTPIRRLEFSLIRITKKLDELHYSVQTAMLGRVPTSLVSPSTCLIF
jgi:hypothetical protein